MRGDYKMLKHLQSIQQRYTTGQAVRRDETDLIYELSVRFKTQQKHYAMLLDILIERLTPEAITDRLLQ
jgi:hypothetical protein